MKPPQRTFIPGRQKRGRPRAGAWEAPIDHAAVAEAVAGRFVRLNPVELAAAIAVLSTRGWAPSGERRRWSSAEIARQLGCSPRTVQYHRAKARARTEAGRR